MKDGIHPIYKKEIDCRKCRNCTGEECLKYGEDADIAVTRCAEEYFKYYKIK